MRYPPCPQHIRATPTPSRIPDRRLRLPVVVLGAAAATVAALGVAVAPTASATETSRDAYVLQPAAGQVIDTSSGQVAAGLAGLAAPTDLGFARDGSRGYVTSRAQDLVSVVDPATNAVLSSIPTGDAPSAVAVSADGARLYVMLGAGVVQVLDVASGAEVARIDVGAVGPIAISPDGTSGYVAAGALHELDLATGTVTASHPVGPSVGATGLVLSPDGTRAYVTASGTYGGTLVVVDLATGTVLDEPGFGPHPGRMAITPDGGRVLVAVSATFVDTGYGAGFMPGRTVRVLDTATGDWIGQIDLGAGGSSWSLQNTASGLAVTPDGGSVYVGVPRTDVVAVADIATLTVTATVPVADPGVIGVEPDTDPAPVPRAVVAADDRGWVTRVGGVAVADVLVNDTVDGVPAVAGDLTVSPTSSTHPGVRLDAATRAVSVASGTQVGSYPVGYRVCVRAAPASCADATVRIRVRPYVLDAADDAGRGSSERAGTVVGDVLANDRLGSSAATLDTVRLRQVSSTSPAVQLRPVTGKVVVTGPTAPGSVTLVYRACERALLANCDPASVAVDLSPGG